MKRNQNSFQEDNGGSQTKKIHVNPAFLKASTNGNADATFVEIDSVVNSLRENYQFWEANGAPASVLSVIREGYKLPFSEFPNPYFKKNNKSALQNEKFVETEILSLLDKGVIRELAHCQSHVNPLTVASNKEKLRLILDLSFLNTHLNIPSVKYEGVETALSYVSPGGYMLKFDMKSGYHHIPIYAEHQEYLSFSWELNGSVKYFCFNSCPFGIASGPHIFTKVLRFVVEYLRTNGVCIVLYLDDGLLICKSKEEAEQVSQFVQRTLRNFGIVTSLPKCVWEPTQCLVFLGVTFDLKAYEIYIPQARIESCIWWIEKFLERNRAVTPRELSKVTGKLSSMEIVLGLIVRLKCRRMYEYINGFGSWDAKGHLRGPQKEELRFWLKALQQLNRKGIKAESKAEVLFSSDASDSNRCSVV